MVAGMRGMSTRSVRVMGSFFMLPAVMVLSGFAVMAGGYRVSGRIARRRVAAGRRAASAEPSDLVEA